MKLQNWKQIIEESEINYDYKTIKVTPA
jgi:hypothetical protein